MTEKAFKFRFASELAGAFVLVSCLLLIVGIFVAGRGQGWFEGKFVLHVEFVREDGTPSEEGSLGLKEGDEVWVLNTAAGRVGKIMPSAEGQMRTTFIIKNRFRPFVRKDAIARVKRKFAVAGDTFAEILMGKAEPMQSGDVIRCRKEEDITDTAQKVLRQVQSVALPMVEQVQQILQNVNALTRDAAPALGQMQQLLEHANAITAEIEGGRGLAGAALKDAELVLGVKQLIRSANEALLQTRRALAETTRLVEGAQKHWLLRKYVARVETQPDLRVPSELDLGDLPAETVEARSALELARLANDAAGTAKQGYNLGLCLTLGGRYDEAADILDEVRGDASISADNIVLTGLLEAEIARRAEGPTQALEAVNSALPGLEGGASAELRFRYHVLAADLYCDMRRTLEAEAELAAMRKLSSPRTSLHLRAEAARLRGRLLLLQDQTGLAADHFDLQADLLQEAGAYFGMAGALAAAGEAYHRSGQFDTAVDRFFRAGRSLYSGGRPAGAMEMVNRAGPALTRVSDPRVAEAIMRLRETIRETVEAGGAPDPSASGSRGGSEGQRAAGPST